jgi:hypothetical protein
MALNGNSAAEVLVHKSYAKDERLLLLNFPPSDLTTERLSQKYVKKKHLHNMNKISRTIKHNLLKPSVLFSPKANKLLSQICTQISLKNIYPVSHILIFRYPGNSGKT